MNLPVIIIGGGGHARVVSELLSLKSIKILGFCSASPTPELEASVLKVPFLGGDRAALKYSPQEVLLCNAIGSAPDLGPRKNAYLHFKKEGFKFVTLIHPSAYVSPTAVLSEGVQIMAGAIVQPFSKIGENSIVNTRASIDHDCLLGAHVHVAPGAVLSGNVTVGEGTHIGTGAAIIQRIKIGENVVIGAGAVVVKDISDSKRVMGIPARATEI